MAYPPQYPPQPPYDPNASYPPQYPPQPPQPPRRYETRVEIYENKRQMKKGIKTLEKQGWMVTNTQVIQGRYGFFKTCFLGCLFLPLALLGQKPEKYQVTFQREILVKK